MSLATRCPACGTVFRVVSDQLKVSEGWVRCGRCADVFNAGQRLFELEQRAGVVAPQAVRPPAQAQASSPRQGADRPAAEPVDDGAVAPPAAAARPALGAPVDDVAEQIAVKALSEVAEQAGRAEQVDRVRHVEHVEQVEQVGQVERAERAGPGLAADAADAAGALSAPVDASAFGQTVAGLRADIEAPGAVSGAAASGPAADVLPESAVEAAGALPVSSSAQPPLQSPAELLAHSADAPHPTARADALADAPAQAPADAAAEPPPGPGSEVPTPQFVRRAERAARWRSPARRGALAVAALVLALSLAGQIALHYRDRVAATWPVAEPWLQAACGLLGCSVDAPRRIDSLSVDSSGLVRMQDSPLYRLTLVLQNKAPTAVRMPAIDLVLTDARGQTLARRVLTAAELGHTAQSLPPGGELTLQALLDLGERRVAGYTVELFYP